MTTPQKPESEVPSAEQFWVDWGYEHSPFIAGLNSLLTLGEVYKFAEAYAAQAVEAATRELNKRDTCVVCGATLLPPEGPPRCETCRLPEE